MAGEDPKYLGWIRSHPCSILGCLVAPVHAHHKTGHGMSQKSHDHESMPLCWQHHRQLHQLNGHFLGWTGHELADWQAEQVTHYRRIFSDDEVF